MDSTGEQKARLKRLGLPDVSAKGPTTAAVVLKHVEGSIRVRNRGKLKRGAGWN